MASPDLTVLHVVEAVEAGVLGHVSHVVSGVPAHHHVALPSVRRGGRTDREIVERIVAAGARTHDVSLTRSPITLANAMAIRRLRSITRSVAPDIVHLHSSIAGVIGRLPTVSSGIPVVYTPNGVSPLRSARVAERLLGARADAIVAVSESEAALIRELRWCRPERVHVIPNGIPVESPPPLHPGLRARLGLGPTAPVIGAVGRLTDQKAPEVVLAAWGEVLAHRDDVTCVWMGDGDRRDDAATAARRWGQGRIHLLGHVEGAAAAIAELDVFCLGSRYEGGPYALLEAMRAGVAIVATDVVGTRDAVEDGRTGLLVPPDDSAALGAAVLSLLEDPDRRAALGAAAQVDQRGRFSVTATNDALLALYRELSRR